MKNNRLYLFVLACVCSMHTFALTFESGGLWFKATSETTAKVIACKGGEYSGDIVIPETVKYDDLTMKVTRIAEFAFSNDSLITSVSIPKTVESMGMVCFGPCYSLKNINVDPENPWYDSVDGVVYNKDHTELLVVPGGKEGEFKVPEGIVKLEFSSFFACRGITKIYIPASVEQIVFEYTPMLDPDQIGDTDIINIGAKTFSAKALQGFVIDQDNPHYAFENCCLIDKSNQYVIKVIGAVPDHYTLPEGIIGMYQGACQNKDNLQEVTISKSLKHLDKGIFAGCPIKKFNIPEDSNLERMESQAINSSEVIDSLYIPSSMKYIAPGISEYVDAVRVAEGLEVFDRNSFFHTKRLYLPSTIRELSGIPSGLEHVEIAPGAAYTAVDNVVYTSDMSRLVECATYGTPNGTFRVPSTVTELTPGAFIDNQTITELIIPGSVKKIPRELFPGENVSKLRRLIFEEGVEEIEDWSITGNPLLYFVYIPSTVKELGSMAIGGNIVEYFDLTPNHLAYFYNAKFAHYKDEEESIKETANGFLVGRGNIEWEEDYGKMIMIDYVGNEERLVIPELIDGEEFIFHNSFLKSTPQVSTVVLPNNKSIFDLLDKRDEAAVFENAQDYIKTIEIPAGTTIATIEGRYENPFANIKPTIILDEANPNMTCENNVLYNKDKSLLIAYTNDEAEEYIMPETVKKICTYAFSHGAGLFNLQGGKFPSLKKLVIGKNVEHISSNTFNFLRMEKLVIPDNVSLASDAIQLWGDFDTKHLEIEIGEGVYVNGSIRCATLDRINANDHTPQDVIIKCNFADPFKVVCPFRTSDDVSWIENVTHETTLHVPYGTKALFESAPGWSNFDYIEETFEYVPEITVRETHTVAYMLEDDVWCKQTVAVGDNIAAPAEPQKPGYKFSGWEGLPTEMGDKDIVVTGFLYKPGDVNEDKNINVADISSTLNIIMDAEGTKKAKKAADVNEDNRVNVADIYCIANYILDGSFVSTSKNASRKAAKGYNYPVALQYDLVNSDAIHAEELSSYTRSYLASTDHEVNVAQVGDNTLRCIIYSVNNSVMKCSAEDLLNVLPDAEAQNIVIVYSDGNALYAARASELQGSGETTGIEQMDEVHAGNNAIYNMMGQKLLKVQRGFNIVNGKKLYVK